MLKILLVALISISLHTTHYKVSSDKSVLSWKGTKKGGEHFGVIKIEEGTINISHGRFIGGSVKINMNEIEIQDTQDSVIQAKILSEIKDTTFFDVKNNPFSTFKVNKIKNDSAFGDLTIKGITKPISFPVTVSYKGRTVVYDAPWFKINRENWNLKFDNWFKEKLVDEDLQFKLHLEANY